MIWFLAYLLTIVAANWAIQTFGVVPVGFGLMAPAGVFFAGLAFTFRDLTQESVGRRATFGAILLGASISAIISPQFAMASGLAFLLSESLDMLVYTPLREKHWLWAVGLSNVAGFVADSVLFLLLAFGSLEFLPGQLLGKLSMTVLAVAVLWTLRRRRVALSVA